MRYERNTRKENRSVTELGYFLYFVFLFFLFFCCFLSIYFLLILLHSLTLSLPYAEVLVYYSLHEATSTCMVSLVDRLFPTVLQVPVQ